MVGHHAILDVKVRPNAGRSLLTQSDDGSWLAQLKAAPVDGKANQELIALVARHFGCAKAAVSISSGAGARHKRLCIAAAPPQAANPQAAPAARRSR